MKIIILAFILLSSTAHAMLGDSIGLVATFKNFKFFESTADTEVIAKTFTTDEIHYQVGIHNLVYRVSYQIKDPNKKTIIAHMGLDGGVEGVFSQFFLTKKEEYLSDYNLILVDTLSSKQAGGMNCFMTVGGIEDVPLVENALRHVLEKTELSKENLKLIMLGGSGSTWTIFHGSKYIKDKYPGALKGMLFFSSYNSLTHHLEVLKKVSEHRKRPYHGYPMTYRVFKMLTTKMIEKRFNSYLDHGCAEDITKDNYNTFSFLEDHYRQARPYLEDFYQELYPGRDFDFSTLEAYHKEIALSNYMEHFDIPFMFLHAQDDPFSGYRYLKTELLDKLQDKPNGKILVTKNGGHGGFSINYGEKWLFDRLKEFFESVAN